MSKEKVLESLFNAINDSKYLYNYFYLSNVVKGTNELVSQPLIKFNFNEYLEKISDPNKKDESVDFLEFNTDIKDYYILAIKNAKIYYGRFFDKEEALTYIRDIYIFRAEEDVLLFKTNPAKRLTFDIKITTE